MILTGQLIIHAVSCSSRVVGSSSHVRGVPGQQINQKPTSRARNLLYVKRTKGLSFMGACIKTVDRGWEPVSCRP